MSHAQVVAEGVALSSLRLLGGHHRLALLGAPYEALPVAGVRQRARRDGRVGGRWEVGGEFPNVLHAFACFLGLKRSHHN